MRLVCQMHFLPQSVGEKVVRYYWIRNPGEAQGWSEDRVPRLVVQIVPHTRALNSRRGRGRSWKPNLLSWQGTVSVGLEVGAGPDLFQYAQRPIRNIQASGQLRRMSASCITFHTSGSLDKISWFRMVVRWIIFEVVNSYFPPLWIPFCPCWRGVSFST